MAICYLGIGSNLGDRRSNIRLAIERIDSLKNTKVIKISSIIETEPLGGSAAQGKFLNACLKVKTGILPCRLLKEIKQIEKELGRKKGPRFGPRPIDLDILLYGNRILKAKSLTVPHPRMFEREFVLKPLLELA